MTDIRVEHDRIGLAQWRQNTTGTLGLVMTMGALHEGHLDLVREARAHCDNVLVTVFVNPLQFGEDEDLDRYPRDLTGDIKKLDAVHADVVFAPSVDVMYPQGKPMVTFNLGAVAADFEGKIRPDHFAGVAEIVTKMFNITRPDVAYFGQKDAQQLAVIRQVVRDLDMPLQISAVPIRRDVDGLALSSRNTYLTEEERASALAMPAALRLGVQEAATSGSAKQVLKVTKDALRAAEGIKIDYIDLVDPMTFQHISEVDGILTGCLIAAIRVGDTRLIDNQLVVLNRN
ncbi:MAG: pantoate--beta-alanine ligase [Varibaculum sp.]|nr:pantoate--beta-alanine ligase [Varibaculum sp.]